MAVEMKYGVFSWNELQSSNVEESKAFYSKLFGWQAEEMPSDSGPYTIFKAGGEQVAGLMQLPQEAADMGAQPYWGAYVSVEDLDAVISAAEQMGGKVLMPPMDVPTVGRFALLMDPQGAVFYALQPSME